MGILIFSCNLKEKNRVNKTIKLWWCYFIINNRYYSMKNSLFILFAFFSITGYAQTSNNLYGIVSKNYYSWVTNPFDSTLTYEQFDSATIRLGYMDPGV